EMRGPRALRDQSDRPASRIRNWIELRFGTLGEVCLQGSDDLRVELVAGQSAELLEHVVVVRSGAVASIRAHGVEGVGYEDDPGRKRDPFAGEPVRVAGAVPVLVVMQDPVVDRVEVETFEERIPQLRVLADLLLFLQRQRSRLSQDLVCEPDLPEIVEEARE